MNEFKNVLRSLREQRKLTRKELSEFTKASHDQIYNWETGRGEPDAATLSRLAEFFDVTADYLLGRVDNPTDELAPISTEPLDQNATYMNDPVADDIMDNIKLMSREDKETIRRLTQSIVNRKTQGVS